jgi:hypothetical protein
MDHDQCLVKSISGIAGIVLFSFMLLSLPACAMGPDVLGKAEAPAYAPGQLIVKFKPDVRVDIVSRSTGVETLDQLNKKYQVQKMKRLFSDVSAPSEETREKLSRRAKRAPKNVEAPDMENIYVLDLAPGADIEAAAAEYSQDPAVVYAEPNGLYRTQKPETRDTLAF